MTAGDSASVIVTLELNHVALQVRDLEASRAFYGETLGFPEIERPDFGFPGAWFRLGTEQDLHLICGREEEVHSQPRGNHYALRVPEIRQVEAFLSERGIPMRGPHQRPDGAWQIFIKDPDGHSVEFTEIADAIRLKPVKEKAAPGE